MKKSTKAILVFILLLIAMFAGGILFNAKMPWLGIFLIVASIATFINYITKYLKPF